MNKEEIIAMAKKAGLFKVSLKIDNKHETLFDMCLFDFAKLVAAQTLMKIDPSSFMSYQEGFEAGQLAEREECAKTAENISSYDRDEPEVSIAKAIRARGQK